MYKLVPAAFFTLELTKKIMEATFDVKNEWFFADGNFNTLALDSNGSCNTWLYDRFVVIDDNNEIIAYFDGAWQRPLNIISNFRTINFSNKPTKSLVNAFFEYLDYLFVNRGCNAFNWFVALENKNAVKQYERFIDKYCGSKIGTKHYGQMSYTGKVSSTNLYEITKEEYFAWKDRGFKKRLT